VDVVEVALGAAGAAAVVVVVSDVTAAVTIPDAVLPSYEAAATAPNAATAARLPTAEPIVRVRSRATARSRSAGLRRWVFVMGEGSSPTPFRLVTPFLTRSTGSGPAACVGPQGPVR